MGAQEGGPGGGPGGGARPGGRGEGAVSPGKPKAHMTANPSVTTAKYD